MGCTASIDNGASLATVVDSTALLTAASEGSVELCKQLAGVTARAVDPTTGNTPLHLAASKGFTECCTILLGNGAELNARNKEGKTALDMGADKDQRETCKYLRQRGAMSATTDLTIVETEGRELAHWVSGDNMVFQGYVCAVSADGRWGVTSLTTTGTSLTGETVAAYPMQIFNLETQQVHGLLYGHSTPIAAVVMTPDGACIWSGSREGTLKCWNTLSGQLIICQHHAGPIRGIGVTADNFKVMAAFTDKTDPILPVERIRLYTVKSMGNMATWQLMDTLKNGHILCAVLSPHGSYVAVGTENGEVVIWDARTGEVQQRIQAGPAPPTMQQWMMQKGDIRQLLRGAANQDEAVGVTGLAISVDGALLAVTTGNDLVVYEMDTFTQKCRISFSHPTKACAVSGNLVAVSSFGRLRLYDVEHPGTPLTFLTVNDNVSIHRTELAVIGETSVCIVGVRPLHVTHAAELVVSCAVAGRSVMAITRVRMRLQPTNALVVEAEYSCGAWVLQDENELTRAILANDVTLATHLLNTGFPMTAGGLFDPIHMASTNGNKEMFELLISFGADVNKLDTRGYNALMVAAISGSEESVKQLLDQGANVDAIDVLGQTALILAAQEGHRGVCQVLLDHRADVNYLCPDQSTPLTAAIRSNHVDALRVVRLLLRRGANVNAHNKDGMTPLMFAVDKGDCNIVDQLLSSSSTLNVDARNAEGRTALSMAAVAKSEVLCQSLLLYGADPVCPDSSNRLPAELFPRITTLVEKLDKASEQLLAAITKGEQRSAAAVLSGIPIVVNKRDGKTGLTPLHRACQVSTFEMVDMMLSLEETRTDMRSVMGETPLHIAVFMNREDVCQALVDRGADRNVRNTMGLTPLMLAVAKSSVPILHLLLAGADDVKADPNMTNQDMETALHMAARQKNKAMVRMLTQSGADLKQKNKDGWTALHVATSVPMNAEVVKLLIVAGCDISERDDSNDAPLHIAAKNNAPLALQVLLEYGADPDTPDGEGQTMLMFCIIVNNVEIAKALVEAGADPNAVDPRSGDTMLLAAARATRFDIVKLLLAAAAQVDARDKHGDSALHIAARTNDVAMCEELLEYGADIDASGKSGHRPTFEAVAHHAYEAVELLLLYGAKVDSADAVGNTLLHKAALMDDARMVKILMHAGADPMKTNDMGLTPELISNSDSVVDLLTNTMVHLRKASLKISKRFGERVSKTRLSVEAGAMPVPTPRPPLTDNNSSRSGDNSPGSGSLGDTIELYNKRFIPQTAQALKHGTSGNVMWAIDVTTGQTVCIKFYREKGLRDRTVTIMSVLRDPRFLATLADFNLQASVFDSPDRQPSSPYAIVMQAGGHSMQDLIDSEYKAHADGLTVNQIAAMLENVVMAVQYMHDAGLAHCDLKLANIVEFGSYQFKLVDLDCASKPRQQLTAITPEICAPEAAAKILANQPVAVMLELDVWALGCVFWQMLTGRPLAAAILPEYDEVDGKRVFLAFTKLKQDTIDNLIKAKVMGKDPKRKNAASLMSKMLRINPEERPRVQQLLEHEFFGGGIAATYDVSQRNMKELGIGVRMLQNNLNNLTDVVRSVSAGVREIAAGVRDLQSRTTLAADLPDSLQAKLDDIMAQVRVGHKLMTELADANCPRTFMIVPVPKGEPVGVLRTWLNNFTTCLKNTGKLIGTVGTTEVPYADTDLTLFDSLSCDQWKLYLVDEFTGQPCGNGYIITEPKASIKRLLPAMAVGLKMVTVLNGALAIVRMLQPGIPVIPYPLLEKARQTLEVLRKKTSAEDFACVQGAFEDRDSRPKNQVGASLREFKLFLNKVDPRDEWAGLMRYITPQGKVLWVHPATLERLMDEDAGSSSS